MIEMGAMVKNELVYVEKISEDDETSAWIGYAETSKSGVTKYFNEKTFELVIGGDLNTNYYETETGEEYWISSVKKNIKENRWTHLDEVLIDSTAINHYMSLLALTKIPKNLKLTSIKPFDPEKTLYNKENLHIIERRLRRLGFFD